MEREVDIEQAFEGQIGCHCQASLYGSRPCQFRAKLISPSHAERAAGGRGIWPFHNGWISGYDGVALHKIAQCRNHQLLVSRHDSSSSILVT